MYMQIIFVSQPNNPRQPKVRVGQLTESWYGAICDSMITYMYTKSKTEYEGQEVYVQYIISKWGIWNEVHVHVAKISSFLTQMVQIWWEIAWAPQNSVWEFASLLDPTAVPIQAT